MGAYPGQPQRTPSRADLPRELQNVERDQRIQSIIGTTQICYIAGIECEASSLVVYALSWTPQDGKIAYNIRIPVESIRFTEVPNSGMWPTPASWEFSH